MRRRLAVWLLVSLGVHAAVVAMVLTLVGLSPRPLPVLFVDLVQGLLGGGKPGAGATADGPHVGASAPRASRATPAEPARPPAVRPRHGLADLPAAADRAPAERQPPAGPPSGPPEAASRPVQPSADSPPAVPPAPPEPSPLAPPAASPAPPPPSLPEPAPPLPVARPEAPRVPGPTASGDRPAADPSPRRGARQGETSAGGDRAPRADSEMGPAGSAPGLGSGIHGVAPGETGEARPGVPDGTDASAGQGAGASDGRGLALAIPGAGGGPGREYDGYMTLLRRRLQETLAYPPAARRRSLSGTVQIEMEILPTGRIGHVAVAVSSTHRVLDEAAMDAAREVGAVPFPPGVPPRALRVRLPVVFDLRARP